MAKVNINTINIGIENIKCYEKLLYEIKIEIKSKVIQALTELSVYRHENNLDNNEFESVEGKLCTIGDLIDQIK